MWKYIVYWSTITTVLIPCPDRQYGYDCGLKHELKVEDSFKADFEHKQHAISFAVIKKEEGFKKVELDSIKKD